MKKTYLPIGTIVLLKGAKKKLMINGFCIFNKEDNKTYDYCGVPYPEGMVEIDTMDLFNHDQIEELIFLGYINTEEQAFKTLLTKEISSKQKNNTTFDNEIIDII